MSSASAKVVFMVGVLYLIVAGAPPAFGREPYRVEFHATLDQAVTWQGGVQIITEITEHSLLELANVRDALPSKPTTFRISIASNEPVTFGPEDVWIEYGKGRRVAMTPYDEIAGRLRRDVKRRQALAAFGGAMMAGSADGQTTGSVSYSGMTSSGTIYNGSGTYFGYDPGLARQEQEQASAQTTATARAIQTRKLQGELAVNGMVRRTSARPLEFIEGIVAFDPPRDLKPNSEIIIIVRLGDQERRIKAALSKR